MKKFVQNVIQKKSMKSQTKTKCWDCGYVTNGISEWVFNYKGEKEYALVYIREDKTCDTERLIELYGEQYEEAINNGEEVCPKCGSTEIYEIREDE